MNYSNVNFSKKYVNPNTNWMLKISVLLKFNNVSILLFLKFIKIILY